MNEWKRHGRLFRNHINRSENVILIAWRHRQTVRKQKCNSVNGCRDSKCPILWMHCFDFSMKSVPVVGCSEGSVSQSSGSLSEMCWRLPQLSPCRGVFKFGFGFTDTPLKLSNPAPPVNHYYEITGPCTVYKIGLRILARKYKFRSYIFIFNNFPFQILERALQLLPNQVSEN